MSYDPNQQQGRLEQQKIARCVLNSCLISLASIKSCRIITQAVNKHGTTSACQL